MAIVQVSPEAVYKLNYHHPHGHALEDKRTNKATLRGLIGAVLTSDLTGAMT
ncbi:hypothetical protein KIN20_027811 [Parelaphostrongylus tenuis]|uniref:Uncharacterized protein n=1 Tax=Parelaphostrongylus tenuis TaxID=148309 RepID=A0AAD5R039_PARTN|nr:hypothetical protein KIN20_027811 [Parelaphostrongylus tenuis]